MKFSSINPFTLKSFADFTPIGAKEEKKKLHLAQKAFINWRNYPVSQRTSCLLALEKNLLQDKIRLATLITQEMGKPLTESILEIEKCALACSYYAQNAENFLANKIVKTSYSHSWVSYEPLGVILGIMPWNFPFWQVIRFAVPCLMAGNTVILKHATNVQLCANALADLMLKSGFPLGSFQNLLLPVKRTEQLLAHPIIKAVSLTGSVKAGSKVAAIAGEHIKKAVLELGGSNAFIVLPDADIKKAVKAAIRGRFANAGQSCIAAKRFIVHEAVHQEFTQLFCEAASELILGDPMLKTTTLGPMARIDLSEQLESQLRKSLKAGAKLLLGGNRNNNLFEATILDMVTPDMPAFAQETFGPLAAISKAGTEAELIKLAQQTNFGLGTSIFSQDIDKAIQLSKQFGDGAVFINDIVKSDPSLPFGGTLNSGYGRELGVEGLHEFVNTKTIVIA